MDIQIVDLDLGNTADDDVDLFLIDINVTSGINFSAPTTYNGMNGYGQIELRFRLSCTENYYGPDCATFCMEKNDEPGHYTCNSDRSIVCQPDYQDPITNCTMCIPAEGCCKCLALLYNCIITTTLSYANGLVNRPGECSYRVVYSLQKSKDGFKPAGVISVAVYKTRSL